MNDEPRAKAPRRRVTAGDAAGAAGGEVGRLVDCSQADDRRMIALVRARPLLFARSNMPVASYYSQVKRLWQEVADQMGWTVADVRRKWSHIRNSYSRHLRNEVSGAVTGRGRVVSRWYLADELAFLRDHMATDVRPSYPSYGASLLEAAGGAEPADVKPFASPWPPPRDVPPELNDDSSGSHPSFTPDDDCSYFQFFKGIYDDYRELPARKRRLFKRQCLNLLHELLDDEEAPMIRCIQTFSDGAPDAGPVDLCAGAGGGSDDERERKPALADLPVLPCQL